MVDLNETHSWRFHDRYGKIVVRLRGPSSKHALLPIFLTLDQQVLQQNWRATPDQMLQIFFLN